MTMFIPAQRVVSRVTQMGLSWSEVVDDLDQAQSITPVAGFDTRLRYCGEKVQAYIEPGTYDGQEALWIVGLRERQVADAPSRTQVVGRETTSRKSGKKGGSGTRWPTTWKELVNRINQHPHAHVENGGKHLRVFLHGAQVQALPCTASDHRALLNACQVLRGLGIDVRR